MFKKIRKKIESKRDSSDLFWKFLVTLKDGIWQLGQIKYLQKKTYDLVHLENYGEKVIPKKTYDLAHLENYGEKVIGPVQSDEALFLYSLVKVIRPTIIVEFGFEVGHSAKNFLKAMPKDSKIYSFDISKESEEISKFFKDDRFKFILKNQEKFEFKDINNNLIDFLFIDASHKLDSNIKTFEKVKDCLKENALIIVHDTGSWSDEFNERNFETGGYYLNENKFPCGYFLNQKEYLHQPDERKFVNYIKEKYPEFNQIHCHSMNTFRHGMTILQLNKKLPV